MIYKSNCGVCRHVQQEPQFSKSKVLETLIEKNIVKSSENSLDYYIRVADHLAWKKTKMVQITDLTKGAFIDFRDKTLKWRKAEIKKTVNTQFRGIYRLEVGYKKE